MLLLPASVRIRDPDQGRKKIRSRIPGNSQFISESLETVFWVKILKFFDKDPESCQPGSGTEKIGSGIRNKNPGSATLLTAKPNGLRSSQNVSEMFNVWNRSNSSFYLHLLYFFPWKYGIREMGKNSHFEQIEKNNPDRHLNCKSDQDPDPRHNVLVRATPQLINQKQWISYVTFSKTLATIFATWITIQPIIINYNWTFTNWVWPEYGGGFGVGDVAQQLPHRRLTCGY